MSTTFIISKFLTRTVVAAAVAAVCLSSAAHARNTASMMVGATVLAPACTASTDTARGAIKCDGSYSYVTKSENDSAVSTMQRATGTRTSTGQRLTVTY